ncbi:MAG: hypothetical protein AABX70_04075 [Nanoarchaeota archaeon]
MAAEDATKTKSAWSQWAKRKFSKARQGLSAGADWTKEFTKQHFGQGPSEWDQHVYGEDPNIRQQFKKNIDRTKEYVSADYEKTRQRMGARVEKARQWNQDRKARKEEKERQEAEEARQRAQEAEQDQIRDQGAQQEALQETEAEDRLNQYDDEIRQAERGSPTHLKYLIAFAVAWFNYFSNFMVIGLVPGLGDVLDGLTELAYLIILKKNGFVPLLIGAIEFIPGADFIPFHPIGVFISWFLFLFSHNPASDVKKRRREYKQKLEKAKSKKQGGSYQEPNGWATLALLSFTFLVIFGIITGYLAFGSTSLILAASILVLAWISLGVFKFPVRLSFDREFVKDLVVALIFIAGILIIIFFLIPSFIGCVRSGECEQMVKEGAINAQIATQDNPLFYYLWPGNWLKIFERQLAISGLQPEGQAETPKVGVRITKMDTRLPTRGAFHEGDPVTVYINLLSTIYYPVTIQHSCTLSATTLSASATPLNTLVIGPADSVDPATTDLYETKEQTVTCTWNNLKKGTYKATYTGSMISTTNAFVTLSFIERQSMESFRAHAPEVDLNKFLFIDPMFKPLYTNGPITIQVDRITQPIALDMDKPRTLNLNLFLESNWTDGRIEHSDQFTLYVPKEMQLQQKPGCDGFDEKTPSSIQDYTTYTALYDKLGRTTETLRRLTCEFVIPEPKKLLGDKSKALKTIAMEISYKYKIQRSIPFTVKT